MNSIAFRSPQMRDDNDLCSLFQKKSERGDCFFNAKIVLDNAIFYGNIKISAHKHAFVFHIHFLDGSQSHIPCIIPHASYVLLQSSFFIPDKKYPLFLIKERVF